MKRSNAIQQSVAKSISLLLLFTITFTLLSCRTGRRQAGESNIVTLRQGFSQPPRHAGVRCWWWWLNSNVTKEAITRDLEEMKAKGFSGAMIFDAGGADQRGNTQVPDGPTFASPQWRQLYKHALNEGERLGLELGLSIQSGWNLGGPNVTPDFAAKQLTWSEIRIEGPAQYEQKLPLPKNRSDYYKDIRVLAYPTGPETKRNPIENLELKAGYKELGGSAPDCRFLLNDHPSSPSEQDVLLGDIRDISQKMAPVGMLKWMVPKGNWTVLRFGYTITNAHVSTYSVDWNGHVIDYLSRDAFDRYWNEVVEPLLEEAGPLAGTTLKQLETDSWECGGMNWSPGFAADFIKYRSYDPIPYLPVFAGKIVEDRDVSNAFLADFRKTLGDCVADNHYKVFAEYAHKYNMQIQPESGGPHAGPLDAIKNLGNSDIVMGEFWAPSPHRPKPVNRFFIKQSSSVAHIYGKKYVGAEAFTTIGPHWNDVLWKSQKPSMDHEFCSGLNMIFFHTFTCSPKEMGIPGQEYFAGTHVNPQVTWWEYSDAFIDYINRCHFLVQQGKFVADVLYYYGDHVPNLVQLKEADPAKVLPGYDYDVTNEDILLQLKVEAGRILVPGGVRYRLLVLPDHKVLSLAAL
ncbi:MAG: glycosyl hydrolase, partial [Sedimentisphaerales bacterium]